MTYKIYFLSFIILFFFTQTCFAMMGNCVYVKGKVFIARNGTTSSLTKGAEIHFGDKIDVGDASLTVLILKNATLKLEPNTKMTITGNQSTHDTNIEVSIGSLVIRKMKNYLHNNNKPKFNVKTQYASMGVRGTLFFVHQGTTPQTTLSVNNGEVAYQANGSQGEIFVGAESTTMGNSENKNLKPRKFGFENKINFNLDTNKNLDSARDLNELIAKAWQNYKDEQEYLWQNKLQEENNIWDQWKQENTQQGSSL